MLLLGTNQRARRAPARTLQHAVHAALGEALAHIANPAVARTAQLRDGVGLQPMAHADQRGDGDVTPDRIPSPERCHGKPAAEQQHVLSLEDRPVDVNQLRVCRGCHAMR